MIAVCGANGTIGKRIVERLLKQQVRVRALIRKPTLESSMPLEFSVADLANTASLTAAFEGVKTVFLLCPIGANQNEMELNVVHSAAKCGVRKIVKLSVMGASVESPIEFARIHGRVEDEIRASGCEWTFLRPNMFMQNLFWYKDSLQQGVLPLPLGLSAVSHVDAEDVAAAASQALLDERHDGKIYTLTGLEALTGAEAADVLSTALGRSIEYKPVSSSDFRTYLKGTGESEYVVDAEAGLFSYWSEGQGSEVTDDVFTVTNVKATTLSAFALREKQALASD